MHILPNARSICVEKQLHIELRWRCVCVRVRDKLNWLKSYIRMWNEMKWITAKRSFGTVTLGSFNLNGINFFIYLIWKCIKLMLHIPSAAFIIQLLLSLLKINFMDRNRHSLTLSLFRVIPNVIYLSSLLLLLCCSPKVQNRREL